MATLLSVSVSARTGSLLFVDVISTSPFTLGLEALNLANLTTSRVLVLGPGESLWDQVSVSTSGSYYTTVMHNGPLINPYLPSSSCQPACSQSLCCEDPVSKASACFGVRDCSHINSGHGFWQETLAVTLPDRAGQAQPKIRSRFNTTNCYKLAIEGPDSLLCIAETTVNNTNAVELRRLDTSKQSSSRVGLFPLGIAVYNEAAAYDAKAGIFYAYLGHRGGGKLHSMDVNTGNLLPPRRWPDNVVISEFAIDPATGIAYAAVHNVTTQHPATFHGLLATLSFSGPEGTPVGWTAVSRFPTFGVQAQGKCTTSPSGGKYVTRKCYDQLNNGFIANGTFFITAFSHHGSLTVPEAVIGVDVHSGEVTLEHAHSNGNMIDMAWTEWTA